MRLTGIKREDPVHTQNAGTFVRAQGDFRFLPARLAGVVITVYAHV